MIGNQRSDRGAGRWTGGQPGNRVGRTEEDRTLREALEALDGGIGLFHPDGSTLYANQAMRRALAGSMGSEIAARVTAALRQLAEGLLAGDANGDRRRMVDCCIVAGARRYRLRGGSVGEGVADVHPSFVLSLDEIVAPVPSEDELKKRFGLTKQEAQVALLLAEGASNREMAKRLFLSEHTTRNYTRKVLVKLGAESRSRVGPVLRGEG